MRKPFRLQSVVTGKALNLGSLTSLVSEFPLGEGWLMMLLTFNLTLTVGTGTTPIVDGEKTIIKNILVKTDKDGIIANIAGLGAFRMAQFQMQCSPYSDAIAATSATYRTQIPLIFANPQLIRPYDSILDTKRYNTIELYVTYGTVADLLSTVGTATIAATMDVQIVKTEKPLGTGQKELPVVKPYIASYPPVDPNVLQYIELEKASDLAVAHWMACCRNSATGGVPFSGVSADTIITAWSFEDNLGFPLQSIPHYDLQYFTKIEQKMETAPVGWIWYNFVKDGSIFSGYKTGDKSKVRVSWVNGTLSTSGVTIGLWGLRQLPK